MKAVYLKYIKWLFVSVLCLLFPGNGKALPLIFELLNGKVTLNVLRSRLPRFKNCPKYLTTSNNIVLMQRTLEKRLSRTNNREFKIRRLRTTTTVKHGTAHDQNHVTVHFSRVILRLRWVVELFRVVGTTENILLVFCRLGNSRISSFRKKVFNSPALSEREAKYVSFV